MSRVGKLCLIGWLVVFPALTTSTHAEEATKGEGVQEKMLRRMEKLEAKVVQLEAEVVRLKSQRAAAMGPSDGSVERSPSEAKAERLLRASSSARPAATDHYESENPPSRTFSLGTRVGYQGFPFGQKEGGFFYSFFFDHSLFGTSLGDMDAEIALGYGHSGSDHVRVSSVLFPGPVKVEFRQIMLSLWPGLKFYPSHLTPDWIRPYVAGGTGIWGDIIETPPLFIGESVGAPELSARKLPTDGAANIYTGAQGGAGIEFSLAPTRVHLLERMNLGFDYRYSAWTAGQRFSTYSFMLSYSP